MYTGILDGVGIALPQMNIYIYIYMQFSYENEQFNPGSLGQAASSEDFSASEFYYTVHVHT